MKSLIVSGLAAAALAASALSGPLFAQTQSDQQMQPGTGGTSKPGVQGAPGSKSGPTMKPTDTMPNQRAAIPQGTKVSPSRQAGEEALEGTDSQNGSATMRQDESKVPGMPGNKSGPASAPATKP